MPTDSIVHEQVAIMIMYFKQIIRDYERANKEDYFQRLRENRVPQIEIKLGGLENLTGTYNSLKPLKAEGNSTYSPLNILPGSYLTPKSNYSRNLDLEKYQKGKQDYV